MDNITHSLVGVALADLAAPGSRRATFVVTGVIAANVPDVDLFYTWMTPAPLGYLLHHRGHTHTIAGLLVLAVVMVMALWNARPIQELDARARRSLVLVITLGLISHLALDAFNSYGVHPFYPFSSRWYYGDAIFIFEPWLWVLFGAAAACNAGSRAMWLVNSCAAAVLPAVAAIAGIVPASALLGFPLIGGAWTTVLRRLPPQGRGAAALVTAVLVLLAWSGLSQLAKNQVQNDFRDRPHGELLDIVLTPSPSSPLCWSVITIEATEEEFLLSRGTLSLAPEWRAPADCALRRLLPASNEWMVGDGLLIRDEIRQSRQALRELAQVDCWTRAWLQFGRAPFLRDGRLADLRFTERVGPSFTSMFVSAGPRGCPSFMTRWEMPRRDLLALDAP